MSCPYSPRTRIRPKAPGSPIRLDGAPRLSFAGGQSDRSGRWPSLVWMTVMPAARAAASRSTSGGTTFWSWPTSLPRVSPKPPGSRKSRCMSMITSAVCPATTRKGDGSAGTSMVVGHRCSSVVVALTGWLTGLVEQPGGECQHRVVGLGRAEQERAGGATVGRRTGRNGGADQVEQVAEVRVVPQRRVGVDRVGEHLRDRERGADGGDHEHVHPVPEPSDLGLQLLETLERREGVDGGVAVPALEDGADDGVDLVGVLGQELAELDEPLGHPRALVEQSARGQEGCERDLDDVAVLGQAVPETEVRAVLGLVAEELELVDRRQTDPDPGPGVVRRAAVARPGSASSRPATTSKTRSTSSTLPAIRLMQSSDLHAGTSPTALISPREGLNPIDAVERGGDPAGARGVRGHRERHLAQRHGERGPGARAARDQVAAEDTPRDGVRGPGAVEPGGELVEARLADEEAAGVEQALHDGSCRARNVG